MFKAKHSQHRSSLKLPQWPTSKQSLTRLRRSVFTRSAAFPWVGRVNLWSSQSPALRGVWARWSSGAALHTFTVTRSVDEAGEVVKTAGPWRTRGTLSARRKVLVTCTYAKKIKSVNCNGCQQADLIMSFKEADVEKKNKDESTGDWSCEANIFCSWWNLSKSPPPPPPLRILK